MIIARFSPSNARDSIRLNCEAESNEIDESDSHSEKQCDLRISTSRGIKIDGSDEFENADDSIRTKREFDLNEIDKSDSQSEKHFDPRISTLLGIKID
jgi:hypothetical protein